MVGAEEEETVKYQVYLFPGPTRGFGLRKDPRRGLKRWYVSYETRRTDNSKARYEQEWLDVETEEEALAARDRRYTELLLAGAKWKGEEKKKIPIPRKKELGPDEYLCKQTVSRVYWTVKVKKEYIGGSFSKIEARKIRDNHFSKREALRPCLCCGKPPVWTGITTLAHDEPDCPSYAIIKARDISKVRKVVIWNKHLRRGKFAVKGVIGKSKIEHLL
jgi:hypothetical protein